MLYFFSLFCLFSRELLKILTTKIIFDNKKTRALFRAGSFVILFSLIFLIVMLQNVFQNHHFKIP